MNIRQPLIVVSSMTIVAFYAANWYVWQHAGSLRDLAYADGFIRLTGGMLATNLGAVCLMAFARLKPGEQQAVRMTFEAAAALSYLAVLVVAVVLWSLDGFDARYVDAIRNLAHTLPGVIAGVLAIEVRKSADAPAKTSFPIRT